jgi:peptidyl-prolyl cis-trans isomerase SurA
MNLRLLFSLVAALALTGSVVAQTYSNGIAAVVNGNPVMKSEVRDAVNAQEQILRFQLQNEPDKLKDELVKLRATALDSLVDRELVLAEFKRLGASIKAQWVDDDINGIIRESFKGDRDAFIRELTSTGMTLKKFREMREKMMIVQAMRGKQAAEQPPATPKEVEDFYKKNIDTWRSGGSVKIRTITLPKFGGEAGTTLESQRKLADEIRTRLTGGADFANMAKTYSQDSRSEDGGAWDWMNRDQLKASIANVAFGMKPGSISPVLDDEAAFIIIACDDIRPGTAKPLAEIREEIERAISSEKSKAIIDKWMEGLRKKAVIKKFGW